MSFLHCVPILSLFLHGSIQLPLSYYSTKQTETQLHPCVLCMSCESDQVRGCLRNTTLLKHSTSILG